MNLDTAIEIDLKGFFRWWARELAFLVPKSLRRRLSDRYGSVLLRSAANGFELDYADEDGVSLVKQSFEFAAPEAFQPFKSQYPALDKAELVFRLASGQALAKTVYLPLAAQENLQQVVGFELDRYTPFSADQVYFSAMPLGKTEFGQIQVLLVAIPKANLDEPLKQLDLFGLRPHKVEYQAAVEEYGEACAGFNLLPEQYRQHPSALSQSVHWLAWAAILLLSLAVLIWPVWLQAQAVDTLKEKVKQLEKQNRAVDAQQTEIDALHAETQKLIDIKRRSPALLSVLDELSRLLNDDTWLTHLNFADNHLQIQGQSPAASTLIGLLEDSTYFNNVSFVSPLTQDKNTGRERFQISMDVAMPAADGAAPDAEDAGEAELKPDAAVGLDNAETADE